MKKYDKSFIMKHYKDCTSFKLTEDILDDNDELVVGSIDVSLTSRCNLKCKDCGSLMQFYEEPRDVELEVIIKSLDRFLKCVDKVVRVNVVGGEAFLHPDMDEVIEYLNYSDKIIKVVIPTNGTVYNVDERVFLALQHSKNQVRISHYEAFNKKTGKLLERLEEYGIDYSVKKFGVNDYLWFDFGGFEKRSRDVEDIAIQYKNCVVEWYSLYNGKLYPCPRAAHAIDLGYIEEEGNYVDCLDEKIPLKILKEQLQEYVYERAYHPACQHCDRGTGKCLVVPVAEQLKS